MPDLFPELRWMIDTPLPQILVSIALDIVLLSRMLLESIEF